jgi:hypothetical protein
MIDDPCVVMGQVKITMDIGNQYSIVMSGSMTHIIATTYTTMYRASVRCFMGGNNIKTIDGPVWFLSAYGVIQYTGYVTKYSKSLFELCRCINIAANSEGFFCGLESCKKEPAESWIHSGA